MNDAEHSQGRKPGFFERLGHFIKGPNPLHPAVWDRRLSPMTFRRFELYDLPQCLEIYKLNEPGRFPEGVIEEYEKSLREQRAYFLVGEKEGRIVATGGIEYYQRPYIAVLCYGLVHPEFHQRGIGAALVLARLALLAGNERVYRVYIAAVAKSIGYYWRFGFQPSVPWRDKQGTTHPSARLVISIEEARDCRKLLESHGISLPHDENKIPLRIKDAQPNDKDHN